MIATPVDLAYLAGDDITLGFAVTDEAGAAANITGDTIRFVVARRAGSTPVLTTEGSPASVTATITTAASGLFTVAVAGAATEGLSGLYRWECELTDLSGGRATVARGTIVFTPDVAR